MLQNHKTHLIGKRRIPVITFTLGKSKPDRLFGMDTRTISLRIKNLGVRGSDIEVQYSAIANLNQHEVGHLLKFCKCTAPPRAVVRYALPCANLRVNLIAIT